MAGEAQWDFALNNRIQSSSIIGLETSDAGCAIGVT